MKSLPMSRARSGEAQFADLAATAVHASKLLEEKAGDEAARIRGRNTANLKPVSQNFVVDEGQSEASAHSQEWSSRGSQPAWVKAHLDGGGSLEDLRA